MLTTAMLVSRYTYRRDVHTADTYIQGAAKNGGMVKFYSGFIVHNFFVRKYYVQATFSVIILWFVIYHTWNNLLIDVSIE